MCCGSFGWNTQAFQVWGWGKGVCVCARTSTCIFNLQRLGSQHNLDTQQQEMACLIT